MSNPIEVTMNPDGSFDLPAIHVAPYVAPVPVDPPVVAPPAPATDPVATPPTVVGMTLTADKDVTALNIGDVFAVVGTLNYSDGSTKAVAANAFGGFDKTIVTNPNSWTGTFTAKGPGSTTITDSNSGVSGKLKVAVLAVGSAPPSDPPPAGTPTPVSPPSQPDASAIVPAVITGTVNGTAINVTVQPGECAPLVPGDFQHGCAMYEDDGSIVIENDYVGAENPTPCDLPMNLTITVGSQTFTTGDIVLWYKCWTRPFWIVPPTVKTFDRSVFPNYGTGSEAASYAAQYAKGDNSILGIATLPKAIGNPGEHDYLGLLNGWDACYLVNPSADAAAVVLGMSDAANPWPFHARDTKTNKMLLASDWPKASMLPACYGKDNPFVAYTTACPYDLGQATGHAPSWHVLAAAMYGSKTIKAALSQWTNYVACLWANPGYRLPNGPCSIQHVESARGIAWTQRQMAQAAKLSDAPDLFDEWVKASIAELAAYLQSQSGRMPMIDTCVNYPTNSIATGYAFAPWQLHFLIQDLGYQIQLGYTEAQVPFDILATMVLDSLLSSQHEFASLYEVSYYDASRVPAKDWAACLTLTAATDPKVAAALACAENSLALRTAMAEPDAMTPGDFDGHPASPVGYGSMLRACAAMIRDYAADQVRAAAAWAVVTQHDRADYSQQPKYNLAPRAVS